MDWRHRGVVRPAVARQAHCLGPPCHRQPSALRRRRHGTLVFVTAALLAQVVEPVLEVPIDDHRLGYDVEAGRWIAFGKSIFASAIAYATMLTRCAPTRSVPAR